MTNRCCRRLQFALKLSPRLPGRAVLATCSRYRPLRPNFRARHRKRAPRPTYLGPARVPARVLPGCSRSVVPALSADTALSRCLRSSASPSPARSIRTPFRWATMTRLAPPLRPDSRSIGRKQAPTRTLLLGGTYERMSSGVCNLATKLSECCKIQVML
jgi:hypothetical protein